MPLYDIFPQANATLGNLVATLVGTGIAILLFAWLALLYATFHASALPFRTLRLQLVALALTGSTIWWFGELNLHGFLQLEGSSAQCQLSFFWFSYVLGSMLLLWIFFYRLIIASFASNAKSSELMSLLLFPAGIFWIPVLTLAIVVIVLGGINYVDGQATRYTTANGFAYCSPSLWLERSMVAMQLIAVFSITGILVVRWPRFQRTIDKKALAGYVMMSITVVINSTLLLVNDLSTFWIHYIDLTCILLTGQVYFWSVMFSTLRQFIFDREAFLVRFQSEYNQSLDEQLGDEKSSPVETSIQPQKSAYLAPPLNFI